MKIRLEHDQDKAAVAHLLETAFARPVLKTFVGRLREEGHAVPALTFVAEEDATIIGYVMMSRATVLGSDGTWEALNLTPLSVTPTYQGRGIGGLLIRHALAAAAEHHEFPVVVVEGDPSFYARFGFHRASAMDLQRPSPKIPDAAFQAFALPGYDPRRHRGAVLYPPLFDELGVIGP